MSSRCLKLLFLFLLPAHLAMAVAPAISNPSAQAPVTQAQFAALQKAVQSAQSAGDNAWMLTSSALVLLMTGPGLALFYGGLVRRKNILSTMMQSFAMMGLVSVLWPSWAILWPLAMATFSLAGSSTSSCAAFRLGQIPTMRPQSPSRPT
jgi:Amt family ammonium transporter